MTIVVALTFDFALRKVHRPSVVSYSIFVETPPTNDETNNERSGKKCKETEEDSDNNGEYINPVTQSDTLS